MLDPKILYQQDYPYESSLTQSGLNHFHEFAVSVKKRFKLNHRDLVIDIGSNVGELLLNFLNNGTKVYGIDPAKNIAEKAIKSCVEALGILDGPSNIDLIFD